MSKEKKNQAVSDMAISKPATASKQLFSSMMRHVTQRCKLPIRNEPSLRADKMKLLYLLIHCLMETNQLSQASCLTCLAGLL